MAWADPVCAEPTPPAEVSIDLLYPGESPRRSGVDDGHVRLLVESAADLPPILVHRPSMRVMDGMHRLVAAIERGETTIAVQFVDGSADDAFIAAVRANTTHGLPLSLADRKASATRILRTHGQWSDRAVAEVAGLSHKTIGRIRARTTADTAQLRAARLGRDGRFRRPDTSQGRAAARALMTTRPGSSLREVSQAVGISVGTVRAVQREMGVVVDDRAVQHPATVLQSLAGDPSLRLRESGRSLLRWLSTHAVEPDDWGDVVGSIPPHCLPAVAELARSFAAVWEQFAAEVQGHDRP